MSARNPFRRILKSLCILAVWAAGGILPSAALAEGSGDSPVYDFVWFPFLEQTYFEYSTALMQDEAEAFCRQFSGESPDYSKTAGIMKSLVREHPFDEGASDAFTEAMAGIDGIMAETFGNTGQPTGFSPVVAWVADAANTSKPYFRLHTIDGQSLRFTPTGFARGLDCAGDANNIVWKLRGSYVRNDPDPVSGDVQPEDTPVLDAGPITLKAADGFDDSVTGVIGFDLGSIKVVLVPTVPAEEATADEPAIRDILAAARDVQAAAKPQVLLLVTPGFIVSPPPPSKKPCKQERADVADAADLLAFFRADFNAQRESLRAGVRAAFNDVANQTAYLKALQKEQAEFEAMDTSGPDGARIKGAIAQGKEDLRQAQLTLSTYETALRLRKEALDRLVSPDSGVRKMLRQYVALLNKLTSRLDACKTVATATPPRVDTNAGAAAFEKIWWQIIRGIWTGIPPEIRTDTPELLLDKDLIDFIADALARATLAQYGQKPANPERAAYVLIPAFPGPVTPDCSEALRKLADARANLANAWKDHTGRLNARRDDVRKLANRLRMQKHYLAELRREQTELDGMDATGTLRERLRGARIQGMADIETAMLKVKDLSGQLAKAEQELAEFRTDAGNYLRINLAQKNVAAALKALEDCQKGVGSPKDAGASAGNTAPRDVTPQSSDTGDAMNAAANDAQDLLRPRVTYEATMKINGSVFHIYQGVGISRTYAPDQPDIVSIVNNNDGTFRQLFLNLGVYVNMQVPNAQLPEITSRENLGSETVNGYQTTKYRLVLKGADGYRADGFYWITDQGITVKTVARQITASGPMDVDIELSNIKTGPIDPAMFTVPDTLKLTTFPLTGGN